MYRAVTGQMSRRPFLVRSVNPTNRARPALVLPVASNRSSSCECFGSGATLGPATNRASISAMDTPCFWHFARFPSSQSNPLTRRFIPVFTIQTYILLRQAGALPTSALEFVPASFLACARSFRFCPRDIRVPKHLDCNFGYDLYEHQTHLWASRFRGGIRSPGRVGLALRVRLMFATFISRPTAHRRFAERLFSAGSGVSASLSILESARPSFCRHALAAE